MMILRSRPRIIDQELHSPPSVPDIRICSHTSDLSVCMLPQQQTKPGVTSHHGLCITALLEGRGSVAQGGRSRVEGAPDSASSLSCSAVRCGAQPPMPHPQLAGPAG